MQWPTFRSRSGWRTWSCYALFEHNRACSKVPWVHLFVTLHQVALAYGTGWDVRMSIKTAYVGEESTGEAIRVRNNKNVFVIVVFHSFLSAYPSTIVDGRPPSSKTVWRGRPQASKVCGARGVGFLAPSALVWMHLRLDCNGALGTYGCSCVLFFCPLGQVQLLSFASSHLFHGHFATCMHWSRTILPTEARRSTTKDGVLFVGSPRGSSGRSPAFVVTGY